MLIRTATPEDAESIEQHRQAGSLSCQTVGRMNLPMSDQLPESIETARLLVRVARPGDGQMFNTAVVESYEHLKQWLGWVSPPPSLHDSEASCRRAYARFLLNEDLTAFFIHKESGSLVGGGGLHNANWKLRQFEVGYWGRTGFLGAGLITEGVVALAEHALQFLNASRVFLTTDDKNVASWRLAERAGFQLEGTLRNERLNLQGELRNTRVYSRVKSHNPTVKGKSFAKQLLTSNGR